MPNIKFSYLYRDSCNYKTYGYVIVPSPGGKTLAELETIIRAKLIDEQWFYAGEWQVPDLFLNHFHTYNDPTWHEFDGVAFTDERSVIAYPSLQRLLRSSQ